MLKLVRNSLKARNSIVGALLLVLTLTFNIFSIDAQKPERLNRRPRPSAPAPQPKPLADTVTVLETDLLTVSETFQLDTVLPQEIVVIDTVPIFDPLTLSDSVPVAPKVFIPDPTRAVWLSALCPGLGQIYNRRYWKLPIVIGGFMGLGYGASWNNGMLRDYTRAYNDLMDNDPSTKSYMDFFPPTTSEESLNRSWLERTMKRRKDYFRRNRDLCIIGMIGVYLISIVDAYVDASLTNFDISPDLSMQVTPAVIRDPMTPLPAIGVNWAVNF